MAPGDQVAAASAPDDISRAMMHLCTGSPRFASVCIYHHRHPSISSSIVGSFKLYKELQLNLQQHPDDALIPLYIYSRCMLAEYSI